MIRIATAIMIHRDLLDPGWRPLRGLAEFFRDVILGLTRQALRCRPLRRLIGELRSAFSSNIATGRARTPATATVIAS